MQRRSLMPDFVYSVKFLCGTQQEDPEGCLTVRPGAYATDINIHNFQNSKTHLEKFFLPLVLPGQVVGREPDSAGPRAHETLVLPPNTATMDDCCNISKLLNLPSAGSSPLTIGFLVIVSSQEVNVTAVY